MKIRILVYAFFIALVACSTRNNRQTNPGLGAGQAPKGTFQGKPESNTGLACTPVDSNTAAFDKDLKKGDQIIADIEITSMTKTIKTKYQTEIVEVSNSLVRSTTTVTMDDGTTIKGDNTCEVVSSGKIECWSTGKDSSKIPAKDYSLNDMPCKVTAEGDPKIEVFSGPYKMVDGQTVKAVRKVQTIVGQVICSADGKSQNAGRGTMTLDQYRSAEVVNSPGDKSGCQETLIFESYRLVLDNGKQIANLKTEAVKAPLRNR